MRLLDLFCGGGGAAFGYYQAGFTVTGVDIEPQPDYPFEFFQADALEFLKEHGHEWDMIHASPPCQRFTPLSALPSQQGKEYPDLVEPTRSLLIESGKPYVMENVVQAGLRDPVVLCGPMFGLRIYRHRAFESSIRLVAPAHKPHKALCMRAGYLPTADRPFMSIHGRNGHNSRAWVAAAAAMGTPWLSSNLNGVCEAIPPAYTRYIGSQVMISLSEGANCGGSTR